MLATAVFELKSITDYATYTSFQVDMNNALLSMTVY
jgi:hypothetical protein